MGCLDKRWKTHWYCTKRKIRKGHTLAKSTQMVRCGTMIFFPVGFFWISVRIGTPCDVADQRSRRTEVRFYCNRNELQVFTSVKEIATCQYVVRVSTKLLCEHEAFTPKMPLVCVCLFLCYFFNSLISNFIHVWHLTYFPVAWDDLFSRWVRWLGDLPSIHTCFIS